MHTTCQQFQEIRDQSLSEHAEAMACRDCESTIARIRDLWDKDRAFFASVVPGSMSRDRSREVTATLRMAEGAMTATLKCAMHSVAKGYSVDGLEWLLACLSEVRTLLARPLARLIAARDPGGGSVDEIAHALVRRARFVDGRPIVTEQIAAEFDCPLQPEPAV